MIHHRDDPHPGRCLNCRPDPTDDYGIRKLRCLRSDGHAEACRFPEPPKQWNFDPQWNSSTPRPRPKPWVEPDVSCECYTIHEERNASCPRNG